jgi:hypothetical protein
MYEKDSFDRFGDDICSLVLSYLPRKLQERFIFVSNQWKRCMFNMTYYAELRTTRNTIGFGETPENRNFSQRFVRKNGNKVLYMKLNVTNFDFNGIIQIIKCAPKLKELKLNFVKDHNNVLGERSLLTLNEALLDIELKSLKLGTPIKFRTEDTLKYFITKYSPILTELWIDPDFAKALFAQLIQSLSNMEKLKKVVFVNCGKKFNSGYREYLSKYCSRIKVLIFYDTIFPSLSEVNLFEFQKYFKNLNHLLIQRKVNYNRVSITDIKPLLSKKSEIMSSIFPQFVESFFYFSSKNKLLIDSMGLFGIYEPNSIEIGTHLRFSAEGYPKLCPFHKLHVH